MVVRAIATRVSDALQNVGFEDSENDAHSVRESDVTGLVRYRSGTDVCQSR